MFKKKTILEEGMEYKACFKKALRGTLFVSKKSATNADKRIFIKKLGEKKALAFFISNYGRDVLINYLYPEKKSLLRAFLIFVLKIPRFNEEHRDAFIYYVHFNVDVDKAMDACGESKQEEGDQRAPPIIEQEEDRFARLLVYLSKTFSDKNNQHAWINSVLD
ncbi:MAG: hypothetical protein JKY13_03750 [Gammaproteobacteria bacterium]|nr:hypothetical protein [Gammaproteobacteria bacterium]